MEGLQATDAASAARADALLPAAAAPAAGKKGKVVPGKKGKKGPPAAAVAQATVNKAAATVAEGGVCGEGKEEGVAECWQAALSMDSLRQVIGELKALGPPPRPRAQTRREYGGGEGEGREEQRGVGKVEGQGASLCEGAGGGVLVGTADAKALQERVEAAERALAKRDSDVSRLREDKTRLEAEADEALSNVRQLQAQLRAKDAAARRRAEARYPTPPSRPPPPAPPTIAPPLSLPLAAALRRVAPLCSLHFYTQTSPGCTRRRRWTRPISVAFGTG